jgi:addiction module RelE/StbE family toxin
MCWARTSWPSSQHDPKISHWTDGTTTTLMQGEWNDHRDCYIRPDLVLIYRKPDAQRLQLVRLGSHAELSL